MGKKTAFYINRTAGGHCYHCFTDGDSVALSQHGERAGQKIGMPLQSTPDHDGGPCLYGG